MTSHIDDLSGRRKLAEYIQAAGILTRLKKTRIAIAGHPFEGMTDLMVYQLSLRKDVGPVCWPLEPEKVSIAMESLPAGEVAALVANERTRYKLDMDDQLFERSCRLALALEKVLRVGNFDGLASFDQVWLTGSTGGDHPLLRHEPAV